MCAQPGKATTSSAEGRRQRRHARYSAEFPVSVTMFGGNEYRRLEAHCKDLSEAGIGMLIAAELAVGEVASLSFSLPETPAPWEVRAVLRHRRGYHYGFEFLSLTHPQNAALGAYLKTLPRADKD